MALAVLLALGACSGQPPVAPSESPRATDVVTPVPQPAAPRPTASAPTPATAEPEAPAVDAPAFPPFPDIGPSAAGRYTPELAAALDDEPAPYLDGCHQLRAEQRVETCVYGDPGSAVRVVLVGDSHAAQWHGGVAAVAEARGWRLETYTKSACPLSTTQVWIRRDAQPYATCSAWNESVLAHLLQDPPDLVVTSMSGEYDAVVDGEKISAGPEADALVAAGVAESWGELLDAGSPVAVIADTGWYPVEVVPCLLEDPDDPVRCDAPRGPALDRSAAPILAAALEAEPRARAFDLTPAVCGPEVCPAVLDGMVVMRDEHHITATFSRWLAPWIDAGLEWATDW